MATVPALERTFGRGVAVSGYFFGVVCEPEPAPAAPVPDGLVAAPALVPVAFGAAEPAPVPVALSAAEPAPVPAVLGEVAPEPVAVAAGFVAADPVAAVAEPPATAGASFAGSASYFTFCEMNMTQSAPAAHEDTCSILAGIDQYEPGVIFLAFVPSSPRIQWLLVPLISTAS